MYVRPVKNRLRTLPVRQYQGPFRNRLPGLGQVFGPPQDVMSDLPLTGPYTNPSALTGAQLGIAAAALNPNLATAESSSITGWLNQNASTLTWVAGITAGILLLSRVVR